MKQDKEICSEEFENADFEAIEKLPEEDAKITLEDIFLITDEEIKELYKKFGLRYPEDNYKNMFLEEN